MYRDIDSGLKDSISHNNIMYVYGLLDSESSTGSTFSTLESSKRHISRLRHKTRSMSLSQSLSFSFSKQSTEAKRYSKDEVHTQ